MDKRVDNDLAAAGLPAADVQTPVSRESWGPRWGACAHVSLCPYACGRRMSPSARAACWPVQTLPSATCPLSVMTQFNQDRLVWE